VGNGEGMNVRAMERGDECDVGNGVDRGRVGVDDDDRGMLVQAQATGILQHLQPKREIKITHNIVANGKGTIKKWARHVRRPRRYNKYCCCCRNQHT